MLSSPAPGERAIATILFTATARVHATLRVSQRRLSDYLNLEERFLILDDPRIEPLTGSTASSGWTAPSAQLNRERLLCAIPTSGEGADPEEKRLAYVRKEPHRVLLSIPPFRCLGMLHLIRENQLRDVFRVTRTVFVPLTQAEITYVPTSQSWLTDILLVQRPQVEWLSPAPGA